MKNLGDSNKKAEAKKPVEAAPVKVDFSNVKIEPIFTDMVDFETFSKSDFRAVKVLACEAVEKSKKLLKFTLDDGQRKDEPIFTDMVDFETFSKSDFRAVKVLACEAVEKSKKLLKFTLDDGQRKDRVILSGIHEYYEPEELVGKTAIAIVNLPSRKMMGINSEGMLISCKLTIKKNDGYQF